MNLEKVNFISLDLETTGLDAKKDSIVEVGLVRFDYRGKILDRYGSLVYFDGEFSDLVASLTGIDAKELLKAPPWEMVKKEILNFVRDEDIIIGHNINFDLSFLASFGINWFGRKNLDSWYLATILIGNLRSYSLEYLLKIIGKEYNAHRALDDAEAVVDLYVYWLAELAKISDKVLYLLCKIAGENNLPESDLYDLEIQRRKLEGVEIIINKNREEKSGVAQRNIRSENSIDNGLNYLPMSFKELLRSERKLGVLVVGSSLWQNFIRTEDYKKYDVVRFDRREKFLCKKFWESFYKKSSFSIVEVRVVIKILLKIDQGYWDGYLDDIMWFNEEKDLAYGLGCRQWEKNHDCYFDRKIQNILRADSDVIAPAVVLEQVGSLRKKKITIFSEDPLLEDGLTDLTGLTFDRDDWLRCCKEILELAARKKVIKQKTGPIDEWMEKMELLWRSLRLLVRSQGQNMDNKISLDFTGAVISSVSFQNLSKQWLVFKKDFLDFFEEIDQAERVNDLRMIMDFLFLTDEWLVSMVEYESGYWRLELKRKKFDSWLINLMNKFCCVDLVNRYPATENNYFWRLLGRGLVSKQNNFRNVGVDINIISWVKYKEQIDEENLGSQLIIFNSKADLAVALDNLREEKIPGRKIFELGSRRSAWYHDLGKDNFSGVVMASYGNLAELGILETKFDTIYLDRLPFDYPNKFVLAARAFEWQDNYFGEYFLPRMYQKLYYVFTLLKPGGKFFMGDERWFKKNYANKNNKWL